MLRDEAGFTLVEVVVALTLLTVAATSFAVTTGNAFGLVGSSQERQSAVQIANQWMEQARVVPFGGLALPADTVFEGEGTPDEGVGGGGTTYAGADGAQETLVLDAGSTFAHAGDESLNTVDYRVYRYVTWVPQADVTEAYKRVTVVVQWLGTGNKIQRVTQSTLISGDGVAWSASVTSTTSTTALGATTTSSTTTSTTSTTSTTLLPTLADCLGDVSGPVATLAVLAGSGALSGFTSSATVIVSMSVVELCLNVEVSFSNDGTTWSPWVAFSSSAAWAVAGTEGTQTMYARFKDGNGNITIQSTSVIVDGSAPTTPGDFTASVLNGPRRVRLTWTPSTDNREVIGYRVYRQQGSGSFQNQVIGVLDPCSTTPCAWSDNSVRNNSSYTYYVVAYDAAGNESVATSQLTRTI